MESAKNVMGNTETGGMLLWTVACLGIRCSPLGSYLKRH